MKTIMVSIVTAATSLLAVCASAQSSPSPATDVDPVAMVDQFEATAGKFEGYRRSGAKGICAMGEFVGSAAARDLSMASVFSGETFPVIMRFSVGGANPNAADNTRSQRNMALQFDLPGGEQWQMGNISTPVFGSSSPQQLLDLLASRQADPATGAANPDLVRAFNEANPEVLLQGNYLASQLVPASYAGVNYWGVHGYGFVNAAGATQYGKWVFEPVAGTQGLTDEEAQARGANFLFDDLRQRVSQGEVAFDFNLELAEPGDTIDNATIALPEGREKVSLGTLKVTSVSEDAGGACLLITFNPMNMPAGVVPSADPMLAGRAAPYVISLSRRLSEGAAQ